MRARERERGSGRHQGRTSDDLVEKRERSRDAVIISNSISCGIRGGREREERWWKENAVCHFNYAVAPALAMLMLQQDTFEGRREKEREKDDDDDDDVDDDEAWNQVTRKSVSKQGAHCRHTSIRCLASHLSGTKSLTRSPLQACTAEERQRQVPTDESGDQQSAIEQNETKHERALALAWDC